MDVKVTDAENNIPLITLFLVTPLVSTPFETRKTIFIVVSIGRVK
jgi:hypothetical protein